MSTCQFSTMREILTPKQTKWLDVNAKANLSGTVVRAQISHDGDRLFGNRGGRAPVIPLIEMGARVILEMKEDRSARRASRVLSGQGKHGN